MLVQGIKAIGLFRTSAKVAVICAVACAAFGAWGAGTSSAAGLPCYEKVFSYAPGTYKPCVYNIQVLLNVIRPRAGDRWPSLGTDGYFGTQTQKAVEGLQNWTVIGVDGIVGPLTWSSLCYEAWISYGDNPPKLGPWAGSGCAAEMKLTYVG